MVRGTFSPARAWRPAAAARLARTLGSARRAMWHSSRISACRRGLNSHDAAEPRIRSGPRQRTMQRSSAQCKNVEHARRDMSRGAARSSDKAPPCHRETPHCVGDPGFQSVRGPAAATATPRLSAVHCGGGLNARPATVGGAEREATVARKQEQQGRGRPTARTRPAQRCLTPRSSGAPTAGRQARSGEIGRAHV